MKLKIIMLRHGATKGNLEKRYVGSTDEDLLDSERCHLMAAAPGFRSRYLDERRVLPLVSPMKRCRQTLELLLPEEYHQQAIIVPGFHEMSFGDFEYKNYRELNGNRDYQRFIDSGGTIAFPDGESRVQFEDRVSNAFVRTVQNLISDDIIHPAEKTYRSLLPPKDSSRPEMLLFLVVHGGTIMALLDRFAVPHQDYFHWQCGCLAGYTADLRIPDNSPEDETPDHSCRTSKSSEMKSFDGTRHSLQITEAEPFRL